jgi:hypothetical protein
MSTNEARFKINSSPAEHATTGDRGYAATLGETLTLTLETNPSSALSVLYEVFSSTDADSPLASKSADTLTFTDSSTYQKLLTDPNGSAELVLPSSGVQSWIVRCTASMADGPDVFERLVVLKTSGLSPNLRKTVPAETQQYASRGFSDTLNDMVDAIASGGGTGGVDTMDETYDAFGATPAIVTVDGSEGQGDLRMKPTGAYSVEFDLSGASGTADGVLITNGSDNFNFVRGGTDILSVDASVQDIKVAASSTMDFDSPSITLDSTGAISIVAATASDFTVSCATSDLTLGARATTITLNDSSNTSLSGFSASSIIGALNELKTSTGAGVTGSFNCISGIAVGDLVRVSASNTAHYASRSGTNRGRAMGLVTEKPTSTTCTVQFVGELAHFTGLTAGSDYYLGVDGAISSSSSTTTGELHQWVGVAKNTTTLVFAPTAPVTL